MAASKIAILTLSVTATAALAAHRAVELDGTYPAAGANSLGITNTAGASGDRVPVDVVGTTIATAGGAVAAGDELEVGADGKLVTKTTGKTVARALAAAADGELFEVLLIAN